MKLQSLAVIFIIIILPIVMVLSAYMDNLKKVIKREALYDSTLMDATYDAVRAYQMNTLNNSFASVNTSKERDVKASLNSFFNSLTSGLGKSGVGKNELNTSIPAVLFTLYDGYYIYGPSQNVASIQNGNINFAENENNMKTEYGLKPYNYYSCHYKKGDEYDLTINYTLDNYISVSGKYNNDKYITASGYYIKTDDIPDLNGVNPSSTFTIQRNGKNITIKPEILGEYVALYDTYEYENTATNTKKTEKTEVHPIRYYRYINYNRVKYYFDDTNYNYITEPNEINSVGKPNTTWDNIPIFYLENNLRIYLTNNTSTNGSLVKQIADYIGCSTNELISDKDKFKDTNAYHYYKDAREFSYKVSSVLSQIDINSSSVKLSTTYNKKYHTTTTNDLNTDTESKSHSKYTDAYQGTEKKIFDTSGENDPELESSLFNAHRIDVIISSIESNLTTTIANLNNFISSDYDYRMPILSETDWYKLANNVTTLTFMQGLPVGNYKFYNNYSLVVNTKNKEYVSKDAIYLQSDNWEKNNATVFYRNSANGQNYHNPRCLELNKTNNETALVGYINSDYEIQSIIDSYNEQERVVNSYMQPHTAGYECIIKKDDVFFTIDEVMKGAEKEVYDEETQQEKKYKVNPEVQRAFITALAREKGASYKNFSNLNL